MDPLSRFIKENRDAFNDEYLLHDALWARIDQKLNPPLIKPHRWYAAARWRIAASILLLCSVLGTFYLYQKSNHMYTYVVENTELSDINAYYGQLIDFKINEVKNSPEFSPKDKDEILNYFTELDQECAQLEGELQNNLDNAIILEAIVNNYRKRLDVLEKLLLRINKSKEKNNDKSIVI